MEHKDVFLLEEIVEFCDRITDTIGKTGGYEEFVKNLDYQDVCAFRALQIGEFVNELSATFKAAHPETEWHRIIGFRNIVAHDYGSVDLEILWSIITKNIPKLRTDCAKAIGAI